MVEQKAEQQKLAHLRASLLAFIVVIAASACTKKTDNLAELAAAKLTPEQSVEKFVRFSASAESIQDRMKLRDLCQGKLRQAFDKMSDTNFQMTYLTGGVVIESFKVVSSKVEAGDALVHYQVSVQNKQGAEPTQEVNEREVSLVQVNGVWFLDSIRPAGKDQVAFVNGMIF